MYGTTYCCCWRLPRKWVGLFGARLLAYDNQFENSLNHRIAPLAKRIGSFSFCKHPNTTEFVPVMPTFEGSETLADLRFRRSRRTRSTPSGLRTLDRLKRILRTPSAFCTHTRKQHIPSSVDLRLNTLECYRKTLWYYLGAM